MCSTSRMRASAACAEVLSLCTAFCISMACWESAASSSESENSVLLDAGESQSSPVAYASARLVLRRRSSIAEMLSGISHPDTSPSPTSGVAPPNSLAASAVPPLSLMIVPPSRAFCHRSPEPRASPVPPYPRPCLNETSSSPDRRSAYLLGPSSRVARPCTTHAQPLRGAVHRVPSRTTAHTACSYMSIYEGLSTWLRLWAFFSWGPGASALLGIREFRLEPRRLLACQSKSVSGERSSPAWGGRTEQRVLLC